MKRVLFVIGALFLLMACTKKEENKVECYDPNTIVLEANPTTGYAWSYVVDQEGIIEIEDEYKADPTDKPVTGSGGKQVFTITPLTTGNVQITFTYAQPWESKDSDTVVIYEVKVFESNGELIVEPSEVK